MRDMVSCLSEHAVRVSESSTCSSNNSNTPPQSSQTSVSSLYNITLSTSKTIPLTITWSTSHGLSLSFTSDPSTPSLKLTTTSRLFGTKKKGSKTIELGDHSKAELLYDLSEATYKSGVEPVDGYYIVVILDSEIGVMLGDLCEAAVSSKKGRWKMAREVVLVSRRECYAGGAAVYTTRVQFSEGGGAHEVAIRCSGGTGEGERVLTVSMDRKSVVMVKRLKWNFRGNQTLFVDGVLVDLLWDVHDWVFREGSTTGLAVFMFRRRSAVESRLWLEPPGKMVDQDLPLFSLLIYASKTS